ncbi:MAG: hypothetical protein AAF686_03155 [Pseudomonadota bacterium]
MALLTVGKLFPYPGPDLMRNVWTTPREEAANRHPPLVAGRVRSVPDASESLAASGLSTQVALLLQSYTVPRLAGAS